MKALFIGLGSIGQRHLRNLKKIVPNVSIIAYRKNKSVPVLSENNKVLAKKQHRTYYNIVEVDTLKKGLQHKPDVIFITNPSSLHLKTLKSVIKENVYIFVEKPIAHNLFELKKFMNKSKKNNLNKIYVGYQYRFNPSINYLKNLISKKLLGNIISIRCINGEYLPSWHPYEDYRDSYAANKNLGGGALLTQIHDFDYIYWLFGMPEFITCFGGKVSNLNINVEDAVQVAMQFKKKIPLTLNLNYLEQPPNRSITVIGDKGSIVCDLTKNIISLKFIDKKIKKINFSNYSRNDMFIDELKDFINFYKGKTKAKVDLQESMQSLYLVEQSKISLKSKSMIRCSIYENKR